MDLISEYRQSCEKYSSQYGPRTLVLIQIGSFYENFSYRDESGAGWGHCIELSSLLNMVLTRRNKHVPVSPDNPYMVGFPCITYDKQREALLGANFTIVRIDQTEKTKEKVDRQVGEIISPATNPDTGFHRLVAIKFEATKTAKTLDQLLIQAGIASIEVSTGRTIIAEFYSSLVYPLSAVQEIYRFLLAMNPTEVIIYTTDIPDEFQAELRRLLDLNRYEMVNFQPAPPPEYLKISYQNSAIAKYFPGATIEILNLERVSTARLTYLLLLQYCYEHNPILLRRLSPPETTWSDSGQHLVLTHNAILQLDLLPTSMKSKFDSIFSVINWTSTPVGRRRLKDLLVNPITSVTQLNTIYDGVESMLEPALLDAVIGQLRKIPDIERLHRRVLMETLQPSELAGLIRTYLTITELLSMLMCSPVGPKILNPCLSPEEIAIFNSTLQWLLVRYSIDQLEKSRIGKNGKLEPMEGTFLRTGIDSFHDGILSNREATHIQLMELIDHLNGFFGSSRGKLLEFDSDTIGFETTVAKAKILMNSNYSVDLVGKLEIRTIGTKTIIASIRITELMTTYLALDTSLRQVLLERFLDGRRFLIETASPIFLTLNSILGHIDILASHATVSNRFGYFRPSAVSDSTSWCQFEDLRHPLVERIIDEPFVANSVSLRGNGILLYGLNSAGKSTLVKAIGISIILAQIGMFVPAKLKFSPYSQIITRLSGNDDLLRGSSSFVVEMSELRTILRQANDRTLVLGDELCRGTESISGASLTIATLLHLSNVKASYIFSTHLHDLPTNTYLRPSIDSDQLRIFHLSTLYDADLDHLTYNRKLVSGPGDSLYGLEVAKSLHLDPEFISKTLEIRRSILAEPKHLLSIQTSRYHPDVYVDACSICGIQSDLQTHHKIEQHTATDTGLILNSAPFPKNSKFNLMVVCESCHQNIHKH